MRIYKQTSSARPRGDPILLSYPQIYNIRCVKINAYTTRYQRKIICTDCFQRFIFKDCIFVPRHDFIDSREQPEEIHCNFCGDNIVEYQSILNCDLCHSAYCHTISYLRDNDVDTDKIVKLRLDLSNGKISEFIYDETPDVENTQVPTINLDD